MFDFVQEKKRFVYVILALLALPFAFFGVSSYQHASDSNEPATVNGVKISARELDNSLRQQEDQLRQRMGANFDPTIFNTPAMKRAVLDNLISQTLVSERAHAMGLTVTDDQVAQMIGSVDAFQVDGKFDQKRYELVLANNNLNDLMYEARVRDELLRQQLAELYSQNGFISSEEVDKVIQLYEQQRVVSVASIPYDQFNSKIKIDSSAVKDYYQQNPKEFAVPEQAKVEYVKLSIAGIMSGISVTDDEAHKYYNDHQSDFSLPEQRQASHILISLPANSTQAEQDAAKAKAEKILAQVDQNPGKFAELAKQYSQDVGSANKGGDLGYFGKGMMVKPFEDAVFSLKEGEVSGLVKSDFGYHIIKLTGIKPGHISSFDEVREDIVNKVKQQKAEDKFAELADKFGNTVYEQSDSLKPAADLIGGKVEQSEWLSKQMPSSDLWNTKSLQAVFSDDVLKQKRNSQAVEIAPSTLISVRLLDYKPASTKLFADVEKNIEQKLLRDQALKMALDEGQSELLALQKTGKSSLNWGKDQIISRAQHGTLDEGLVQQIFQADAMKLPQYVGSEERQSGYQIVRVEAIKNGGRPDATKEARYAQQLRQMTGEDLFQDYIADSRSHAKITVNLPATSQPANE